MIFINVLDIVISCISIFYDIFFLNFVKNNKKKLIFWGPIGAISNIQKIFLIC